MNQFGILALGILAVIIFYAAIEKFAILPPDQQWTLSHVIETLAVRHPLWIWICGLAIGWLTSYFYGHVCM